MEKALIQAIKNEKHDLRYYVLNSDHIEEIINTYNQKDFDRNICSGFTEEQRFQIIADRILSAYLKGIN